MAGRALSSVPTPKVHGLCGDKGRGHLRPLEGRNGNKRRWLTDSATGAAPALVSQHLHVWRRTSLRRTMAAGLRPGRLSLCQHRKSTAFVGTKAEVTSNPYGRVEWQQTALTH
jgi:hypothetical protein